MVNHALLVDHKSHNSRISPFRRPGDQGKATNHPAIDDVIIFAGGRVFALAGEDFEIVTMVWRRLVVNHLGGAVIALKPGLGDEWPEGA